jgi:hypothetical protein
MPLWLMGLISAVSFLTAFKCPKCQDFNRPNPVAKITPSSSNKEILNLIRTVPIKVKLINSNDTTLYVFPLDSVPVEYSVQYRHDIEHCSGIVKPDSEFKKIKWFVATTPIFQISGDPAIGAYFRYENFIVLGLFSAGDAKVVRHEILHFYLNLPETVWDESRNSFVPNDLHPDYMFGNFHGKCRGLVTSH